MRKLLMTVFLFFFLAAAALAGVNVNTADQATLVSIPHIGPTKAAAIIEYRKDHPFKSVEELVNVKGIGIKTVEKIKELISVSN